MTWQAGIRGPDPPRRGPLERRIAPQRAQGAQRHQDWIRVGRVFMPPDLSAVQGHGSLEQTSTTGIDGSSFTLSVLSVSSGVTPSWLGLRGCGGLWLLGVRRRGTVGWTKPLQGSGRWGDWFPGWRTESQLRTKFPDPHITDRQRSGCHHEGQEGHEKNSGIATSWKRCLPIWSACLERAFLRALHALRGLLFGAWLWIGARAARGGD